MGGQQWSPSSGPKATLFSGLPICPQAPRWPQGSRGSMSFRVWGKINRGPRAAVIQIPCFPTGRIRVRNTCFGAVTTCSSGEGHAHLHGLWHY